LLVRGSIPGTAYPKPKSNPMKPIASHPILTVLFLPAFLLFGCTPMAEEEPDYAKLEQEAREMFSYSMELFDARNLDALVARFTADGLLKLPNTPPVAGHDALRAYYGRTIQLENFKLVLHPTKVEVAKAGDMAYALAGFEVSFNTPAGPFADHGNSLMVLKREGDAWKIVAETLSSGAKTE
jgi:ketosteroid isomerase-like protein